MATDRRDALTDREREVFALMDRGLTNQEIADRLGITVPGVKYHVSQILSKLGVGSRREVGAGRSWVAFAWRAGLGAVAAAAVLALVVLAIGVLLADDEEDTAVVAVPSATPTPPGSEPSPTLEPTADPLPSPRGDSTTNPALLEPVTAVTSEPGVYSVLPNGHGLQSLADEASVEAISSLGLVAVAPFCEFPSDITLIDAEDGTAMSAATIDGIVRSLTWSPDGRSIVASVLEAATPHEPVSYLLDTQGSPPLKIPSMRGVSGEDAWASDSSRIAFITAGSPEALTLYDVLSHASTDLVSGPELSSPRWSPSNDWIAYLSIGEDGRPSVWVVPAAGGSPSLVSDNGAIIDWYPEGNALLVTGIGGGQSNEFFRISVDSGERENLGAFSSVALSPDGALLADYSFIGTQQTQLSVTNAAGRVVVSGHIDPIGDAAFSPDSQSIIFTGQEVQRDSSGFILDASGRNLYIVNVDGSDLRLLADPSISMHMVGWSSDGRVVFGDGADTGCEDPFS